VRVNADKGLIFHADMRRFLHLPRKFKDSKKTRRLWRLKSLDEGMKISQMIPTLMPTEKMFFGVDCNINEDGAHVITVSDSLIHCFTSEGLQSTICLGMFAQHAKMIHSPEGKDFNHAQALTSMVVAQHVFTGSPAESAEIEVGSIIVRVDGQCIAHLDEEEIRDLTRHFRGAEITGFSALWLRIALPGVENSVKSP
jgi:hypothetical protein